MAAHQDPSLADGTSIQVSKVVWNGFSLLCDTSTGAIRPIVPLQFRRPIFNAFHALSHPGARPSIRIIASRFVWKDMRRDIREWCHQCHCCHASNVSRHVRAPVSRTPRPTGALAASTSTWLAPSHRRRSTGTSSPSWIVSLGGQRPSPSKTSLPHPAAAHVAAAGCTHLSRHGSKQIQCRGTSKPNRNSNR